MAFVTQERPILPGAFVFALQHLDIRFYHDLDQLGEPNLRLPPEDPVGLAGVTEQVVHFVRTEVTGIDFSMIALIQPCVLESQLPQTPEPYAHLAGGHDKSHAAFPVAAFATSLPRIPAHNPNRASHPDFLEK